MLIKFELPVFLDTANVERKVFAHIPIEYDVPEISQDDMKLALKFDRETQFGPERIEIFSDSENYFKRLTGSLVIDGASATIRTTFNAYLSDINFDNGDIFPKNKEISKNIQSWLKQMAGSKGRPDTHLNTIFPSNFRDAYKQSTNYHPDNIYELKRVQIADQNIEIAREKFIDTLKNIRICDGKLYKITSEPFVVAFCNKKENETKFYYELICKEEELADQIKAIPFGATSTAAFYSEPAGILNIHDYISHSNKSESDSKIRNFSNLEINYLPHTNIESEAATILDAAYTFRWRLAANIANNNSEKSIRNLFDYLHDSGITEIDRRLRNGIKKSSPSFIHSDIFEARDLVRDVDFEYFNDMPISEMNQQSPDSIHHTVLYLKKCLTHMAQAFELSDHDIYVRNINFS